MKIARSHWLVLAALTIATGALSGGGCGSDSATGATGDAPCTAGQQIACACPGNGVGVQVCEASGTAFGACDCGTGGSDAGGGGAATTCDGFSACGTATQDCRCTDCDGDASCKGAGGCDHDGVCDWVEQGTACDDCAVDHTCHVDGFCQDAELCSCKDCNGTHRCGGFGGGLQDPICDDFTLDCGTERPCACGECVGTQACKHHHGTGGAGGSGGGGGQGGRGGGDACVGGGSFLGAGGHGGEGDVKLCHNNGVCEVFEDPSCADCVNAHCGYSGGAGGI